MSPSRDSGVAASAGRRTKRGVMAYRGYVPLPAVELLVVRL
jgi:hypothetical protein